MDKEFLGEFFGFRILGYLEKLCHKPFNLLILASAAFLYENFLEKAAISSPKLLLITGVSYVGTGTIGGGNDFSIFFLLVV